LPTEFVVILKYSRALRFEESPDYDYCRSIFRDLMTKHNVAEDGVYDWTVKDNIPLQ
jgi:hypothetical protein